MLRKTKSCWPGCALTALLQINIYRQWENKHKGFVALWESVLSKTRRSLLCFVVRSTRKIQQSSFLFSSQRGTNTTDNHKASEPSPPKQQSTACSCTDLQHIVQCWETCVTCGLLQCNLNITASHLVFSCACALQSVLHCTKLCSRPFHNVRTTFCATLHEINCHNLPENHVATLVLVDAKGCIVILSVVYGRTPWGAS